MKEIAKEGLTIPLIDLTDGPFIINLGTTVNKGILTYGRWMLGGPQGAKERLVEAMKDINQLPEGLHFLELKAKADEIFNSHQLFRIDR